MVHGLLKGYFMDFAGGSIYRPEVFPVMSRLMTDGVGALGMLRDQRSKITACCSFRG